MVSEHGLAAKESIINIKEEIKQEEASIVVNASLMVGTEPDVRRENGTLKKLTRPPRYFEIDIKEIHKHKRKRKPCYICGDISHEGGHCDQFSDCFICSKRGHLAMECPDKNVEVHCTSRLCLICGNKGHDMSSCTNGYDSEDLKVVECYVCNKVGHIYCVDNRTEGPKEPSCYNCGQSGHPGSECTKEIATDLEPLCSRCGQGGHSRPECKAKRVGKAKRKKKTNPMPEAKPNRWWIPKTVDQYYRKPGSNVWLSPAAAAARSSLRHRAVVLPHHQRINHLAGTQVHNYFCSLSQFPHLYWNSHNRPQINLHLIQETGIILPQPETQISQNSFYPMIQLPHPTSNRLKANRIPQPANQNPASSHRRVPLPLTGIQILQLRLNHQTLLPHQVDNHRTGSASL